MPDFDIGSVRTPCYVVDERLLEKKYEDTEKRF